MAQMFLNKEISVRDLVKGVEFEVDVENDHISDDSSDENFDDLLNGEEKFVSEYDVALKPRYVSGIIIPFNKLKEKMISITDDGLILKEVLVSTAGEVIPDKSIVYIHYEAYLDDRKEPFDSTRLRRKPYKFLLGDGNLISGLEIGIQTMKKGELSRIMVHPKYAFGEIGVPPRIPGNAEILYEVQIINFIVGKDAVDYEEMSTEDQKKAPFEKIVGIYHCNNQLATDFFRRKMYKSAIGRYRRITNLLQDIPVANEEEDEQRNDYLLKLYLNLSVCYLNVRNPQKALIYADLALKLNPNNVKGLYRMGRALCLTGSYNRAEHYLYLAQKHKPFDKSITLALKELEQKRKFHQDWEKMFCQKMFGSEETKPKSDIKFEEPDDFTFCIGEQIKEFLNSDEREYLFSSFFNERQLEVVKHFARKYNLAFVSKIVDGQKLNKVAKRNCPP
ncbi:inactive peptidyl-prolyl cis-trans isomerase FKBP6 [Nephila pilipes]|uniref:peptidylprolyl isomerase n=1 Tax=Nephila pilipes TaxID=299642 RepID=A0A8X6PFS1_NEPPI|nr:inactive peptidyl-prolyl cis-trans isomerase FKBP6 [Nephila pilipes]